MEDFRSDGAIIPSMKIDLMDHQTKALQFLDNGKVLYGGVGVGKSAVALAYYLQKEAPRRIHIITTAKKRDSHDWDSEAAKFGIGTEYSATTAGVLTVDSWNNVGDYTESRDAFFVFDEQRLVGSGAWVKAFLKIAKNNRWIMLSGTPGDTWMDYAPLFVANGFYKNATDFKRQHVVYAPYVKFPIIRGYLNEQKLERLRNEILVEMPYLRHTERIMNYIPVQYDKELVEAVIKNRWNVFEDRPVKDVGELWRLIRMITNSDPSRLEAVKFLMKFHKRLIVFYTFDYELRILRGLAKSGVNLGEYNGHKKNAVPETDEWVYLVQYTAGAESWNCITTDAMVLYSMTYSYKTHEQAQGRIDRLNTPFTDLYYYILQSLSPVDVAVKKAQDDKQTFNESAKGDIRQILMGERGFDDTLTDKYDL